MSSTLVEAAPSSASAVVSTPSSASSAAAPTARPNSSRLSKLCLRASRFPNQ